MNPILKLFRRLSPRPAPPSPRPFDLNAFRQELRGVPPDGVLWTQLLALLDAYALTEARALSSPGLDDAEAHRLRGRVGLCFDLKQDLERLMAEARAKEE
jgi:hypothetical protein